MTLLSVVRDVCATVGVVQPTSIFSGITGNRTMQEMVALANEMAQRISYDARDWTKFRTMATFVGDGDTTAFNLPANYKRMLLNSNVWRSTSSQQPMRFVPDTDTWMQRRVAEASDFDAWGEWTMLGGQMHIYPALAAGQSATFSYLDKNCIELTGGGRGDIFQNDLDVFALDERLLKLGMVAQWKAQKGSPYAEDMGTFGDALTMMAGHDSPAPIIIGRKPISDYARVAIPSQTIYFPGATP
jgi:hypothetical protein